jgi:hypothetical protein
MNKSRDKKTNFHLEKNVVAFIVSNLSEIQSEFEKEIRKRMHWTERQYRDAVQNKKPLTIYENAMIGGFFDQQWQTLFYGVNDYRLEEMTVFIGGGKRR